MGTNVGAVVEPPPPPHPPPHPNNPAPSPFHCLPVNPGYFGRTSWLSWFSRKKSRGRTGQETTLKQPRKLIFQSWNQIFGQVTRQWAWPTGTTQKESTSSAIYCKITISFGELLIFTSTFLGGFFFANFQTRISYFFTMGLSPCTAWVGDRYIGEVISPFRTLPWQKMTAQFQFFQSLPHKKADFVKKSRQNLGYTFWIGDRPCFFFLCI